MCPKSRRRPDLIDCYSCNQDPNRRLDVDRVFGCLADSRRREVLCLLDEEPEWTLVRLVDRLSTDESAPRGEPDRATETTLYHGHLPKLEAAGLVSTADDCRIVRRGENYPLGRAVLEAAASEFA